MQPTPIKINKPAANNNESAKPTKNILNLTGSPAKARTNGWKKYLWLLLVLAIAEGVGLAWLYLLKPISPYQRLLPPNAVASTYFYHNSLLNLIKSQRSANANWPPLAWGESTLKSFLSQAKIDQPEQLLAMLADQMALAILPQETQAGPVWLILGSIKVSGDQFSRSREQIEQKLKQNFNLTSELYRQIKISQVQSLKETKLDLFYAEVNGYFILTNNEDVIKTTIDKIIK